MNQDKLNKKLSIFDLPEGHQFCVDLLKFFDEEMGTYTGMDNEWYLFYVRKFKEQLTKQRIVDNTKTKQIDLEDMINEIKNEKT